MNFAFIDGRVSEAAYKEEHELAYDQSQKQAEPKGETNDLAGADAPEEPGP